MREAKEEYKIATVQHSALTDPQIHEPKGVATATASQVYKANGSGSGSWAKLTETDINYTDATKNKFGWADIADSQYTSGSPRAISANTRTLITNNALGSQTNQTRLDTNWDTTNSQFLIDDLNAFYIMRLNCKMAAVAAAGTPYVAKFEVESGNGSTVISGYTQIIKGGSYTNLITVPGMLYVGSFINNYPLKLYVTPDTNITMWDIGFVLQRTYTET